MRDRLQGGGHAVDGPALPPFSICQMPSLREAQLRADPLGEAMDRISIQSFCVENLPFLQQLQVNLFHIKGSLAVINYGCILQ